MPTPREPHIRSGSHESAAVQTATDLRLRTVADLDETLLPEPV